MKEFIKSLIRKSGFEIRRIEPFPPAGIGRPLGSLRHFLEDIRARGFDAKVIVDVGANETHWSTAAATHFPGARFFLFDPLANFERGMNAFVAAHPGSRCWLAGVGREDGFLQFNAVFDPDGHPSSGSSFLKPWQGTDHKMEPQRVPVVTLDNLVKSGDLPNNPDIVKIDTEGYELNVLAGAQSLFGNVQLFIIETTLYPLWNQPLFHEIVAYMAERDYLLYDIAGFNRRPKDGALINFDACFLKRDSPLRREMAWS